MTNSSETDSETADASRTDDDTSRAAVRATVSALLERVRPVLARPTTMAGGRQTTTPVLIADGGQSNAKVIGYNQNSGQTVGVWGEVDSPDGCGFATPDDIRIDGTITTNETDYIVEAGTTTTGDAQNVIQGHASNSVTDGAVGATIGGGGFDDGSSVEQNVVRDDFGTIGGGVENRAGSDDSDPTTAPGATIGGGAINTASNSMATIGGGSRNDADALQSTIGGGRLNTASGERATVGGGDRNIASGLEATVGGGDENHASGDAATVGGGVNNEASESPATIGGGGGNTAAASYATVSGGGVNEASGSNSTVGGGRNNIANSLNATVAGGNDNTASGTQATVAGGIGNTASGNKAFIGGGDTNVAGDFNAVVAGGFENVASAKATAIGGGAYNEVSARRAAVGGGVRNTASAEKATVGGGEHNTVAAKWATIAGGGPSDPSSPSTTNNVAYDNYGTIGGGGNNQAGTNDGDPTTAEFATVGGGRVNTASGAWATVGGGLGNTASDVDATVGGGNNNTASGVEATVPGGARGAAESDKSFVWNDGSQYHFIPNSSSDGLSSDTSVNVENVTGSNTFSVSAQGGVRFITGSDKVTFIEPGETGWSTWSSRAAKTNIKPVDPETILDGVEELEVATWEYENGDGDSAGTTHIGPMAEDFHDIVDLGSSDEHINSINADGVLFAAVQGLSEKLDEKDDQIDDQQDQIDELEMENDRLRERLTAVEAHLGLDSAADPTPADD